MESNIDFSYSAFDRQIANLLAMGNAVIDGWDGYALVEMNIDLKSLTIKASRLCEMADYDRAHQTESIVRERSEANRSHFRQIDTFISNVLGPFVKQIAEHLKQGQHMQGQSVRRSLSMAEMLPCIVQEIDNPHRMDDIVRITAELEKVMKKNKPVVFPGMTDMERFWLIYEFFTMMCYLLWHFQTMSNQSNAEINPDEVGRLLIRLVQQYADSDGGKAELQRCIEVLRFDNGGRLTAKELRDARIALRKEVPESLQLCFVQHINDIDALGRSLLDIEEKSADDVRQLLVVVAKWQMLTEELDRLEHPQADEEDLPNEVFHDRLHDRRISMKDLRTRIERMLPLVKKKNHWFCLWAVLRYHNLLCSNNTESFARQMLSPAWFGERKGVLPFSGDTLREYAGYFTDTTFKCWNATSFSIYRSTHNKKKWSEKLCNTFIGLCEEMNERFVNDGFHSQR